MKKSERDLKHVTGAQWLAHVENAITGASVNVEQLPSGAVRLWKGATRITVAALRHIDPRDLRDLCAGRQVP